MTRKNVFLAALVIVVGAAIFLAGWRWSDARRRPVRPGFVGVHGTQFVLNGRPFRFIGANAAIFYGEETAQMPGRLQAIAQDGVRVVRVWASGESGADDGLKSGIAQNDWLRTNPFRRGPDDWNEAAFVHLDHILAEAERNHLFVQLCLVNWWRDTGGIIRYLDWAGIADARDDSKPFGINTDRALLFYSNDKARELYREHVRRIVTRRNTVTGKLYIDDPTIMGYELMNEAQAPTGRWAERKAWVAEMSTYLRSLDENHLISPGTWGYRNGIERRAWIDEHSLPNIDYCDVHHYPRDDTDSFVDSAQTMGEFMDNRVAASVQVGKPLVIGEFGMVPEGFHGMSRVDWFRAYFDSAVRAGVAGAMCWIYTNDTTRDYGITPDPRDNPTHAEIKRAAELMIMQAAAAPPANVMDLEHHLIPHQFAFNRPVNDPVTMPKITVRPEGILYQFHPESAVAGRFERIDGGFGYVWGVGMGYFDYLVPERAYRKRIGRIIVRANLKPVEPYDAHGQVFNSRVTLFINGADCGSKLLLTPGPGQVLLQTWTIDSWGIRLQAARGLPLIIRFSIEPMADQPYGLNISNWPEGYVAQDTMPVEVEVN
ncbi:MAG: cellulase family glycosylhydrolase [Pyrinomonadaceae bacterium]